MLIPILAGNLAAALTCLSVVLALRVSNLRFWEGVPRARGAGAALGFAVLLGFIPNVEPMFSASAHIVLLVLAAVVLTVLCYLYIDYVFARAFAGFLIVGAHASLAESVAAGLRFSSFFALMCLFMGSAGILIAAKPYWFRDFFRLAARSKTWRFVWAALFFLWAVSSLVMIFEAAGRAG